MTALIAIAGLAALVLVFLAVGVVFGALVLLAVIVALIAASVAVGIVIGDAVGSIGNGRRRAPDVPYWSAR
jgi:hypothetical protein